MTRPAGALLGGLLDQALVGVALQVGVEAQPLVAIHKLLYQPLQLRRVLYPIAGLAEDHAQHVVARTEFFEDQAVVLLQLDSRASQKRGPAEARGHHPLAAELLELLVGHLQEQQIGELLQVLAVRQPVVTQNVAEVPQPLHQCPRIGGHVLALRRAGFAGRDAAMRSRSTDAGSSSGSCDTNRPANPAARIDRRSA